MANTEKKKRRTFSSEEKVSLIQEHLVKGKSVSDICSREDIQVSQFYQWQSDFFTLAGNVFDRSSSKPKKEAQLEKQVSEISEKLTRKHEVLSELLEEHIALKKKLGVR